MKSIIDMVNNDYNDEHLSGILLHYPKYFCHMLEVLIFLDEMVDYFMELFQLTILTRVSFHFVTPNFKFHFLELTWPVPAEFIPYNIFDEPIDPVTDLPSAAMQQDITEAIVE
ncbi:hypothetical protein RI129_008313 [Pyrocoelia pectoralis]|uniref:Uncharacterized protein n=1 Tax=Pyrocoelia pectoralis TaxID=417401 RepID=A0AAN7VAV8_9COLE